MEQAQHDAVADKLGAVAACGRPLFAEDIVREESLTNVAHSHHPRALMDTDQYHACTGNRHGHIIVPIDIVLRMCSTKPTTPLDQNWAPLDQNQPPLSAQIRAMRGRSRPKVGPISGSSFRVAFGST